MTLETNKPININERGLEMFLGPLEAAVMRAIWSGRVTSRPIWKHVRDNYTSRKTEESAYTSVTSTITRLFKQGYITRTGDGTAGYTYKPLYATEVDFVNTIVKATIEAFIESYPREFGTAIVNHYRRTQVANVEAMERTQ